MWPPLPIWRFSFITNLCNFSWNQENQIKCTLTLKSSKNQLQNTIAICPFPCIPGAPGIPTGMGRKKRRRRSGSGLEPEDTKFIEFWSAKEISSRIGKTVNSSSRRADDDISIAAVLSLQFWKGISEAEPDVAFCQLSKSISVTNPVPLFWSNRLYWLIPIFWLEKYFSNTGDSTRVAPIDVAFEALLCLVFNH